MGLNSMATPSTEQVSWTRRSPELSSRSTPTGRYYRWVGSTWSWAPSIPRCFQMSLIFLLRYLLRTRQKFGLFVASLKWGASDQRRAWQLRRYRWNLKSKVYLWSLPNTAQRMYWRHILPLSHRLEQLRMWMNYRRVQTRVKNMFQPSLRKTAQRKFGESDDTT